MENGKSMVRLLSWASYGCVHGLLEAQIQGQHVDPLPIMDSAGAKCLL